jgi:hypothetical protein
MEYLLDGCDADLVCVGHTHWPLDIRVAGTNVINPGSVSNPVPPDIRASYAIVHARESGYRVEHHRVDYDRERVIEQLEKVRYPSGSYIAQVLRGMHKPRWRLPTSPSSGQYGGARLTPVEGECTANAGQRCTI